MTRIGGLIATLILLSQGACGDGGPSTADANPDTLIDASINDGGSGDPILDSLTGLGVDVSDGVRVDDNGNMLPAEFAPFGSFLEVGRIDEFLFLGNAGISRIFDLDKASPTVLLSLDDSTEPWINEDNDAQKFPQSTRAAGALDIDGDGRDETIIVYVDLNDPLADMQLKAHIIDDEVDGFATSTQMLDLRANIKDINIATGDINGDGLDELVVGVSNGAQGSLLVFANNAGQLQIVESSEVTFAEDIAATDKSFRLVTGNLDYDRALETAVVFNEQKGNSTLVGGSRYAIFDDLGNGFLALDAGPISVIDNGAFVVLAGDVSIGDVDGDNIGEVVLGGLGTLEHRCDTKPLLVRVLDDRVGGFAVLGQKSINYSPICKTAGPRLNFAPVNTPDLDGDGVDEISIFSHTISSFVASSPFQRITAFTIPDNEFYDGDNFLDRNSFTIVEGEANGDGKQDLIVYSQVTNTNAIRAWGDDEVLGWSLLKSMPGPSGPLMHAQLVPMNIDNDTAVLRYVETGKKFVFTAPIVLATLAAPPCHKDIGQFELGCFTTFGNEISNKVSEEEVISTTASATVGFKLSNEASQSEFSLKGTVTGTANAIKGGGYSYTSSIVYSTGTQEDSVIFTTIPHDQYTYEVVSHPDPDLVGKRNRGFVAPFHYHSHGGTRILQFACS